MVNNPQVTFLLKKAAARSGGDRYTTRLPSGTDWDVYFPQEISRHASADGQPAARIRITIEEVD